MRNFSIRAANSSLATGIGLRTPHYQEFLARRPAVGFVEVHSENFFVRGGQPHRVLEQVRTDYPLSLHGVGLSLGSAQRPDPRHLQQLQQLVQRYEPLWVSDHLAWVGIDGYYSNDLLPLPYTEEALAVMIDNVSRVQDHLQRPMLIENPSAYLAFADSTIPEWEFLNALVSATGCGLLLDINNIYVSAVNLDFDPYQYLRSIRADSIQEYHLAGFSDVDGYIIDTHNHPVRDEVWELFRHAQMTTGNMPTLIEWDADLPALDVLLQQAAMADWHRGVASSREVRHAIAG